MTLLLTPRSVLVLICVLPLARFCFHTAYLGSITVDWFVFSRVSYKCSHYAGFLWLLWFSVTIWVHIPVACIKSHCFYYWVLFRCMYISQFDDPFSCHRHVGCFGWHKAAVNPCVQVSVQTQASFLFDAYLGVEWLGQNGGHRFNLSNCQAAVWDD